MDFPLSGKVFYLKRSEVLHVFCILCTSCINPILYTIVCWVGGCEVGDRMVLEVDDRMVLEVGDRMFREMEYRMVREVGHHIWFVS